jgi:hypothetical protein
MEKLEIFNPNTGEKIAKVTPGKAWSPCVGDNCLHPSHDIEEVKMNLIGDIDDYKDFVAQMIYDANDGCCHVCGINTSEHGHDRDCALIQFQKDHLQVNRVPKECYEQFGKDLDGCSRQQNEGCTGCRCLDKG